MSEAVDIAGPALSRAVLMREATRTSRRWQVYGARMGFSGVLIGLLMMGMWMTINYATWLTGNDVSNFSTLGRGLYITFTVIQTLLALVMAPMMVARGVIEERLSGTLQLMVLTPIKTRALLVSKILSHVLVLQMIVLGSLPLMGLVMSLGGVGVDEVVLITVDMVLTVFIMGSLGAYFGMFTNSPVIATVASVGWAVGAYVGLPFCHGFISGSWHVPAQFSPFFISLGNWWGLLIVLSYLPVLWLILEMSTRMFELKIANAELRQYFSAKVWSSKKMFIGLLIYCVVALLLVPVAIVAAWWSSIAFKFNAASLSEAQLQGLYVPFVVGGVGRFLSWLITIGLAVFSTWFYLRLGMDMVDALDSFVGSSGAKRARLKRSIGHKIWSNPVLWREARVSGWGGGGMALLGIWATILFLIFQSGLWVIPGGLLTVGLVNAAATLAWAMWSGAGSMEQERRSGTLPVLMLTSMASWRIVAGKVGALMIPTGPILLFSMGLIVVGYPHMDLWSGDAMRLDDALLRGVLAACWLVPVWITLAVLAVGLGLRMKRLDSVFGMSLALGGMMLGIPTFVAWIFQSVPWVPVPARLVVPALVPYPQWWEFLLSMVGWSGLVVMGFVVLSVRLRRWAGVSRA